jgi:hypothetical protein
MITIHLYQITGKSKRSPNQQTKQTVTLIKYILTPVDNQAWITSNFN